MATQTTVSTDAQDYAPGAWAEITATGFDPGSTVTFQVQHASDPGADGVWGTMDDVTVDLGGDGHDTWSVEDGSALDLDGTVNGAVVTSWYVNPDDSMNWHFLLTAMAANQQTASTSFTDATGSTNKVYQHWADGDAATKSAAEWNNNILNANKSDYFEGEVIPHVFVYKASSQVPLVNGQTYSFNVTYNYYQQNTNALGFDFLTTFNASRTPGQLGVTNPAITPTLDSAFSNGGGFTSFGSPSISQGIYTVDADITNISTATSSGSGSLDRQVTITFKYTGTTTSNGVAEIYYGLHLAGPTATTKGASAWTGGSLQTTVDIGGSGATSIQLSPAAIIAGSISGVKFNDLNGNGVRDAGESGIEGVKIYLDLNKDGVLNAGDVSQATDSNGFYSFSVTPDADKTTVANDPYIVLEAVPSGWTQTSVNPAPITISAATPTYTNVNFGNQQKIASMTIAKDVDKASVDAAGTVLNYTITVKNTGNVDLTTVKLTDTFAAATLDSGDTNNDHVLGVGEVWVYKASHTVTQDEMDKGGAIVNVAKVTTDQTTEQQDDASTSVGQSPSLTIAKDVDKASVDAAGTVLNYTITVTNTGNVSLTNVNLVDDFAAAALDSGDTDNDHVLDVGEVWVYKASHTVTQDEMNAGKDIVNAATVDTDQTNPQSDDAITKIKQAPSALIAPTNTTIQQYIDGSAQTFQKYYGTNGLENGVIQYTTKTNGAITQTNPGVFFYFTGLSGLIKYDSASDLNSFGKMEINIYQSNSKNDANFNFQTVKNSVQLYKVTDTNNNGVIDASDALVTMSTKSYTVTEASGNIKLIFAAAASDLAANTDASVSDVWYLASVKYNTGSVVGKNPGVSTIHYVYQTNFAGATETYAKGIDLAPKPASAMHLEGDEGSGARAVNEAQIKHVTEAAITWWEQHADLNDEQIALLRDTQVSIQDLGKDTVDDGDGMGWLLGKFTFDGVITIDDDAADHGWSLGLGGVAQNKVDLFSVLVHEMGHVLGKTDQDMGGTLAVGERMLPQISVTPPEGDDDQDAGDVPDDDQSGDHGHHGVPTIEHMLTLVGSAAAEQQMHLHMS